MGSVPNIPGLDKPCRLTLPKYCDRDGYGRLWYEGRSRRAHEVAYLLDRGLDAVADGHEVHHLCRARACVEPDHLVALPVAKHRAMRGDACRVCGTVYPVEPDLDGRGHRQCAVCRAARQDCRRERRRASSISGSERSSYRRENALRPVDVVERFHGELMQRWPRACLAPGFGRDARLIREQWGPYFPMREVLAVLLTAVRKWELLVHRLHDVGVIERATLLGYRAPEHPTVPFLTGRMEFVVEWCRSIDADAVRPAAPDELRPPVDNFGGQVDWDAVVEAGEAAWIAAAADHGYFVRGLRPADRREVAREARLLAINHHFMKAPSSQTQRETLQRAVDHVPAVMRRVAQDWERFVEATGVRSAPSFPTTDFLIQHFTEAVNFQIAAVEAEAENARRQAEWRDRMARIEPRKRLRGA